MNFLFGKKKEQEKILLNWENMRQDRGEFIEQVVRDMKKTLKPYGRFDSRDVFHMSSGLPLETMKKVLEYQKKTLKVIKEVLAFLEDGEADLMKRNRQAMNTRKELLTLLDNDISDVPPGIVQLYRLNEEIDESKYL